MAGIDADFKDFYDNKIAPYNTPFEKFSYFVQKYVENRKKNKNKLDMGQKEQLSNAKFSERFFERFLTETTNDVYTFMRHYPKTIKFGEKKVPRDVDFDLHTKLGNKTLLIDIKKNIDEVHVDVFKAWLASEDEDFRRQYEIFLLVWEEETIDNQNFSLLEEFLWRKVICGFCHLAPDNEVNFQSQLNALLRVLKLI